MFCADVSSGTSRSTSCHLTREEWTREVTRPERLRVAHRGQKHTLGPISGCVMLGPRAHPVLQPLFQTGPCSGPSLPARVELLLGCSCPWVLRADPAVMSSWSAPARASRCWLGKSPF